MKLRLFKSPVCLKNVCPINYIGQPGGIFLFCLYSPQNYSMTIYKIPKKSPAYLKKMFVQLIKLDNQAGFFCFAHIAPKIIL